MGQYKSSKYPFNWRIDEIRNLGTCVSLAAIVSGCQPGPPPQAQTKTQELKTQITAHSQGDENRIGVIENVEPSNVGLSNNSERSGGEKLVEQSASDPLASVDVDNDKHVDDDNVRLASAQEESHGSNPKTPPEVEKVRIRFGAPIPEQKVVAVQNASEESDQTTERPRVELASSTTESTVSVDDPPGADAKQKAVSLADRRLPTTGEAPLNNTQKGKSTIDSIVVATEAEKNQQIALDWPKPIAAFFITGQQNGYLEPCGCTGLENQKGGLNRRDSLLKMVTDRGWDVIPIDAGNQIRRMGRQGEMKFTKSSDAMKAMAYQAIAFGPEDLNLSFTELLLAFTDTEAKHKSPFVSANVVVYDDSFVEKFKIVEVGERKIGITAVLGDELRKKVQNLDITIHPASDSLRTIAKKLEEEGCNYRVLIAHASLDESAKLAQLVPHFDLVITAGGYGEPTYKPEPIEGTKSLMVQVGVKGMYVGLLGLYDDANSPVRYQRIALSSQFDDSARMTDLFKKYQSELKQTGFAGLGLRPLTHSSNLEFVGSEKCGDCHTKAFETWKNTPHAHATDSLIKPPERSEIERHFDPECLSCHVTGWNPQEFFPYRTGYQSVEATPQMMQNGCENCHGPGSAHVSAEEADSQENSVLARLREGMRLTMDRARDKCLECHDMDNSPQFHQDGAFEEYWEQVKHYGKD